VHKKELEMVRNIYDDILKTDDYRGRMDIEKYGMLSESVRRRESCVKAVQWVGKLNFTLRLKETGYEQKRTVEARYWSGVGLKTPDPRPLVPSPHLVINQRNS